MAEIVVGTTLKKRFPGCGWHEGEVTSVDGDTVEVEWKDGSESTLTVAAALKALAPGELPPKPPTKKAKKPAAKTVVAPAPDDGNSNSHSKDVRSGLKKVDAHAKAWLDSHKASESPKTPEVLAMLRMLGDKWPTQQRPNVTDTGKAVPGMCVGLVFALGQGAMTSLISRHHPHMVKFLVRWTRSTLPQTQKGNEFPFSSLQVNYNYAAIKHVDGNNIGPSYIMSIGDHTGGALWTADQGVVECHNRWKLFDGNQEHYTKPFKGERISFIAFAHEQYNKLEAGTAAQLTGMGFTAARSDRKDLEFFARFRIERSYLSDEHNDKFRQELAKRKQANDPASLGPGDVAVECYGRQAERGGGWMAFKGAKGAVTLDLTPNSVGIWCAELKFVNGKLELKDHRRVDFYNKREKATASFQQQVKAAPAGTPFVLGIADTACAASRPLGQGVYNTLQLLGAPEDMPKIEYRVAWAMVGFKGAAPGTALHAMGTRSTLLRLDATLSQAGGKTKLVKKAEADLTSIIDVCIGSGQDAAVANDEPAKKKSKK